MVDRENHWNSEGYKALNRNLLHDLDSLNDGDQIFLDYDGTLVPIVMDPETCFLPKERRVVLRAIEERYELYIVSGRTLQDLKRFTGLDMNFVYLHGLAVSTHGKIVSFLPDPEKYDAAFNTIRKDLSLQGFEGLRIYDKQYGMVFHLGLVPDALRNEIVCRVKTLASENDLEVYQGKNLVEIKVKGVNKGDAIRRLRKGGHCLIAGDENTDEDGFNTCPDCISIHVGNGSTSARFSVSDVDEMESVLRYLAYKP